MSSLKCLLLLFFMILHTFIFAQYKIIEKGIASYYHDDLESHKTANGELYRPAEMTAAHLTLPFNTLVKVLNLSNNKSVLVRINDRGPFIDKRIIDLSRAAADSLDFIYQGLAKVEVKVISLGNNIRVSNSIAANTKRKYSKIINSEITDVKNTLFDTNIITLKQSVISSVEIPKKLITDLKIEIIDTTEISGLVLYGVQIGSFSKKSNMEKLSKRLTGNFIEKFNVQEIKKRNTLFYRIILGEFEEESMAMKLKERIQKEFPESFIIKYNH